VSFAPLLPSDAASVRPEAIAAKRRVTAPWRAAALGCLLLGLPLAAQAAPFLWDEDGDRVDDRIETVHLLGYSFAFENQDTLGRQRIGVTRVAADLAYSLYVVYDHVPTNDDQTALALLGMPVLYRYDAMPAFRSVGTFVQVQAAANLPGIERVEAIPVLYPELHEAAGSIGARDPSEHAFPTWYGTGGADGTGQVIAILDTGVNDAPDGAYPGHESLIGRCLGGGDFTGADSTVDTPKDGSVNPEDHGGSATLSHGTHVASIALGSGGPSGYAVGIAPGARFVDVKVLDDTGSGTGVAEALDWCIANRSRDWGGPAGYEGIDVINLSLSSIDATDGNDLASQLADRATQLGIVVVASMGNDGHSAHVPSPAGGDGVIAVGAYDHAHTPDLSDDSFATFDNTGPRASDGDGDSADEQKPNLLAPGVAVLAANGDLSTDGAQYRRLSGTSMSAAFVSGAALALRSAYPSLTPSAIRDLLQATAWRQLPGAPAGTGGVDPRWRSSVGFGVLDLYAARLEMEQPTRTQIDRLEIQPLPPSSVRGTIRTQREMGAAYVVFERAPDVNGSPGWFAPYDSAATTGDGSLADASNRAVYTRTWSVPSDELGASFWYRASCTEGGMRYDTPARRVASPSGPPVATIQATIVHNAYDNDVLAQVVVGDGGSAASVSKASGHTLPLPGTAEAVSSDWVSGVSTTGNVAWTFSVDVPAGGDIASFLPPRSDQPWRLDVTEGGFLNRSGRVTDFRVIVHNPNGDDVYVGTPLPLQTIEGATVHVTSPANALGVPVATPMLELRMGPNPVVAGARVRFWSAKPVREPVRVLDLQGREMARFDFSPSAGGYGATWEARDAAGHPLTPGLYFAHLGRSADLRLVVLRP
jgi:hypothetical protein